MSDIQPDHEKEDCKEELEEHGDGVYDPYANMARRISLVADFMMNSNWFPQRKERSPPCVDEKKLRELLKDRTYRLKITQYQRRYRARYPAPGDVHELFVCRIPKQWFEDKLIPLFQEFGKIYEVCWMINKRTGYNKGFCFVSYYNKEDTEKALSMLNKYEVKPGWMLKAHFTSLNSRLRLHNIPRDKSVEELREDLEKVSPGIKDVTVYCTSEMKENNIKNRGYCFVEYENRKQALRAMSKLKYRWKLLLGYKVAVKWDCRQEEPDEEYMSKVKVVRVSNLMRNTKRQDLKKKFEEFGNVEKVHVVRDLGFIQFEKREDALKAIEEMNGKVFGKYEIVCCLSRKRRKARNEEGTSTDSIMAEANPGQNIKDYDEDPCWQGNAQSKRFSWITIIFTGMLLRNHIIMSL